MPSLQQSVCNALSEADRLGPSALRGALRGRRNPLPLRQDRNDDLLIDAAYLYAGAADRRQLELENGRPVLDAQKDYAKDVAVATAALRSSAMYSTS